MNEDVIDVQSFITMSSSRSGAYKYDLGEHLWTLSNGAEISNGLRGFEGGTVGCSVV
jgi:hypothetical protein